MTYYGADYYPEQETWEDIRQDARRMRDQGFNAVRIGEFIWTLLEPRDGEFHLEWLLKVIQTLGEQGIYTIVCTPSACPPIWMTEKYPEILYRDNRGIVRPFGGRRHYCYNNETYRRYCVRIAEEIAKATTGNPYIIGYHIDNELAQEATGRCQCPVCREKFHEWLKRKYSTIEDWNRRAGTVFWNQTYERFDQIPLPLKSAETEGADFLSPFMDNPTLRLEFERFSSDSMVDFLNLQAEALRRYEPSKPLTTNTTGVWTSGLNYYDAFRSLDIVSVDEYPSLRHCNLVYSAFSYAFIHGIKGKEKFWVVETSSGGGQGVWEWQGVPQPYPGTLKEAAVHAAACGADLFTYFQYKTFRCGAEQLEAAVMDIDGIERRKNKEMRETAALLKQLQPLLEKTHIKNDIAVGFDYDSHWAIRIKPFYNGFSYQGYVMHWHTQLKQIGLDADVIPLDETILKYKILILPAAVILSVSFRDLLRRFVRQGGLLLATFLTGIKNEDNTADRVSVPAGLTDVFGLRVGEVDPVYDGMQALVRFQLGDETVRSGNHTWTESLELLDAKAIAWYETTYRAGEPVAAVHSYGAGKAYYIGTSPDDEVIRKLLMMVCSQGGCLPAPFALPDGTEAVTRMDGEIPDYFLFNHREEESEIFVKVPCKNLLTGAALEGSCRFQPKEFAVLRPL